jgi:molybdopterin-guanine dinucleotide biosynthesis protein A
VRSVVGAIVAGGNAERFGGAPKGLENVGGQRIIDRVATALRAVSSQLTIISNAPDASAWIPGVRAYADVRSERGSLIGIHTALTRADDDVLVVAWDMPFVSPALLRLILDRRRAESLAVFPVGPSGPEPFCALYTHACLPLIEAALDAGDLRLSRLVESIPRAERIPMRDIEPLGDPAKLFFNVNSADDLRTAEALDATGGPGASPQ